MVKRKNFRDDKGESGEKIMDDLETSFLVKNDVSTGKRYYGITLEVSDKKHMTEYLDSSIDYYVNTNFKKKEKAFDNQIKLDLIDNGFVLNGHQFPFPARASELIKILGEARIVEDQCPDSLKEVYCEEYGFDINTFNPWDYYWDELGLLARTYDHETIHMLTISLRPSGYPFPMPKKCFIGTLLVHGNPWHNEVVKSRGGSLQFDKCYASVHSNGNIKKEKSIRHLEFKLKSKEKLVFFDQTDEVQKILSFCTPESADKQVAEPSLEKSNIYIMGKYWNHYIGDTDDSLSLIEYLADKRCRKIKLKDVFSELGFDSNDYNFRNPQVSLVVSLRDGIEIDFKYAIQVLCDLAAILLECRRNGSVDLQELGGCALEKDEIPISLISTAAEEKILLKVLADFCKSPMDYNLSEMCETEELEEMAAICDELRDELSN